MTNYKTIFENEEFIVVNKPPGLLTHGAEHIYEQTLVDQLLKDYPELSKIGEDPSRPGIMHRLDKLASGILVIAKTQDSFDNLKKQFQDRIVKKYYTALVYGRIDKDEDTINFPIERSAKGYKMAAKPRTVRGQVYQNGKRAITEFKVIKRYINYTLLEVRIKTGRTHQIRVHLSAYGYPVVGDDLYGTKKTKDKNKKLGLNRLYLVANKIEFNDLNRNSHSFSIEIPDNFKKFLTQIK